MAKKDSAFHLRVMAEYASSGIWVMEQTGPFRHYMIDWEALGLPEDLSRDFAAWIDTYWLCLDGKLDLPPFNATGRSLARRLKDFMGADTYVEYDPQSEGDEPRVPETIS